ncbi:MAG: M28 family metallopeptidase [Promethearchaeota archaeon]
MENNHDIQKQLFNKERIYNYVKSFSFPRLAGSEGEKKAVDLTVKTFKDIGFKEDQIEREPFEFSDFYSTTLIKLIMILNLTFSLVLILFSYIYPFIIIIIIGIMVAIVLLIIRGLKHPEYPGFWGKYYGDTISATNVFVKLPARLLESEFLGNIVISAHLDSKSQTLKTCWRVVIYRIWLFSGIILGGFFIIFFINIFTILEVDIRIIGIGIWTTIILISASNIMLLFLNTNNKSPGALDNATGMAIVFELSSYFKDNPLNNFNTWFCQFSAEELGTMGSRVFVNNHENQFVKGKIFQINLDMVSSAKHSFNKNRVEYLKSFGILPRKKIAPVLSEYLDKAAKKENIQIHGFHLTTGAHLDSVPFHLRGYSAVDISTRAAALWTHNETDTPDKVDPQVLLEAAIIVKKTITMLDNDYKKLIKKIGN